MIALHSTRIRSCIVNRYETSFFTVLSSLALALLLESALIFLALVTSSLPLNIRSPPRSQRNLAR